MDIFASSSLWEGLPTVLMEAMACDIPIVATDIPGTNELITQDQDGLLVSPYNAEALSAGILTLLNSQELRTELVQEARSTLVDYSIDSIAKEYEILYEELMSKK
jgi:glycosyltransferase involved in cell wall biosynthesis